MKKILALFLVITLLATNLFTGTVYADSEYDLQDVNKTAQCLAGWDVDVEVGTLDYNCDGRVNLKDLVLLAQFVAGWNVVIGNGNNSIIPDDAYTQSVSATVTPVDGKVPAGGVVISNGSISATVPEGVLLNANTTTITLKIAYLNNSAGGVVAGENEELVPVDVHIEGVSKANTVPIIINMGKMLPEGLNLGNYKFFHVEDGVAKVMTLVDSADALTAHNTFTYDANTGEVTVAMATFSPVIVVYDTVNPWQGNEDSSWYNVNETELTITNADQLYSFAKIVGGMAEGIEQDSFDDKTVKLLSDINLNQKTVVEGGIERIFYPVGYYNNDDPDKYDEKTGVAITSGFYTFEGTFDGNGHTISNIYQNTWDMKGDHNWYAPEDQHYRDGMGIFGKVYGGTIKNLTVDNFESDGEITTTGVIAAYADGATFENIAITNCNPRVYNIGNGGIVGCVGWYAKDADMKTTFKNITVDNSNKISALWGSYDVACGGIVGQYYPTSGQTSAGTPKNAGIHFENCHAAAQMDVYNDVCGNYQYYAYRYAGILMGSVRENVTGEDGHVYPKMDGITAENCTVHYGDWNDYYYCELVANSLASYTHDHQFSRLEQVTNVDVENKTITPLNGETYVVPDSGRYNYVVVNGEHATENATCYHFVDGKVHNHNDYNDDSVDDYETVNGVSILVENNQHIYLEFNNLVTGYGWGVTSKAVDDMEGVTILDDHEAYSVEKFAVKENVITSYKEGMTVSVGKLFEALDGVNVPVKPANVQVFVSPVGEGSTASATFTPSATENWQEATITFGNGVGLANITITDYYFCKPIPFTVNVTALSEADAYLNDYNNWNMYWGDDQIPGYAKDDDGDNTTVMNVHDSNSSNAAINNISDYGRTDNNSICITSGSNGHNTYIKLEDIKPNKDYRLIFYYSGDKTAANNEIIHSYYLFTPSVENVGNIGIGYAMNGCIYSAGWNFAFHNPNGVHNDANKRTSDYNTASNVVVGKDNWNKIEMSFNSQSFEDTLFLVFKNSVTNIWIDDISLVEVNQNNSADMWNGKGDTLFIKDGNGNALTSLANIAYEDSAPVNYPGSEGYIHISDFASQRVTTKLSNLLPNTDYTLKFSYLAPLAPAYDTNTNKYYHISAIGIVTVDGKYSTVDNGDTISCITHYSGFENSKNSDKRTQIKEGQIGWKNNWINQEITFNSGENEELMLVLVGGGQSTENKDNTAKKDIYITNFELVKNN